ncbi:hypothetical protein OOT46_02525 [Aquabacterium sp. A7-Y]|uniref:hypothetical protein n=1 Tax=Aquabacterium sp. A7-Y TaxID=1349605 RepID=UPI00223E005A|nr:hypothetical protein [Aquabacterium sp. A7-Y]MCW7536729.1 hypothetical protein [Aquabacterium sp. A7-Y]
MQHERLWSAQPEMTSRNYLLNRQTDFLRESKDDLIELFATANKIQLYRERTTAAGLWSILFGALVQALFLTVLFSPVPVILTLAVLAVVPHSDNAYSASMQWILSLFYVGAFGWLVLKRNGDWALYTQQSQHVGTRSIVLDLEKRHLVAAETFDHFPKRNKTSKVQLAMIRVVYRYFEAPPYGDDIDHSGVHLELRPQVSFGMDWADRSLSRHALYEQNRVSWDSDYVEVVQALVDRMEIEAIVPESR